MKNKIKGSVLALSFVFASTFNVMADKDVAININELPVTAQKVLSINFPQAKVALAKKEVDMFDKSYDVVFTNGNKIEFDADGRWEKISCKLGSVPSTMIPTFILEYVKKHYEGVNVLSIEREKKGYEVELSNGIELEFNKNGRCVKVEN